MLNKITGFLFTIFSAIGFTFFSFSIVRRYRRRRKWRRINVRKFIENIAWNNAMLLHTPTCNCPMVISFRGNENDKIGDVIAELRDNGVNIGFEEVNGSILLTYACHCKQEKL